MSCHSVPRIALAMAILSLASCDRPTAPAQPEQVKDAAFSKDSPPAKGYSFEIRKLEDYGLGSFAQGVNSAGAIVGGVYLSGGGFQARTWTRDGYADLPHHL